MKLLESQVEKALRLAVEAIGGIFLKLGGQGARGKPDRIILYKGQVLFLEIKRPGEKPEPLQLWWLRKLRAQGFNADWCDTEDKGRQIIETTFNIKLP